MKDFKVIGVVHLLPLPGSPFYRGNLKEIIKSAIEDTRVFVENGIKSVIVENFGDSPFVKDKLPPETVASFAAIAFEIKEKFPELELGINALRNAAKDAVAIGYASGAEFIRINIPIAFMATPEGLIEGKIREAIELREKLNYRVKFFEDILVKHAWLPRDISLEEILYETIHRGYADSVVVTGRATGFPTPVEIVKKVKKLSTVPVFVGSGITPENIAEYYYYCDGVIVGTSFKKDQKTENPVDPARVRAFMEKLNSLRFI